MWPVPRRPHLPRRDRPPANFCSFYCLPRFPGFLLRHLKLLLSRRPLLLYLHKLCISDRSEGSSVRRTNRTSSGNPPYRVDREISFGQLYSELPTFIWFISTIRWRLSAVAHKWRILYHVKNYYVVGWYIANIAVCKWNNRPENERRQLCREKHISGTHWLNHCFITAISSMITTRLGFM